MAQEGGCLCGAVRYRVRAPLSAVLLCHCGQCRRWHGHVGAWTSAPRAAVTITGEAALAWYQSSPGVLRGFCTGCGSSLFWRRADGAELDIAAGTLDQPTGLATAAHIWVDSRGDYYEIADGLPQHPEAEPGTPRP
jgi:hypothetical protein